MTTHFEEANIELASSHPDSSPIYPEDLDAPSETPVTISQLPPPKSTGMPIRIIPLYNQPSQVINVDPHDVHAANFSSPSYYFAIGSSTSDGVTKYTLVRKPRRYRVRPPPVPPVPPVPREGTENTHLRNLWRAFQATLWHTPRQAEEIDEEDCEGRFSLPWDNSRPTKRRKY